VREKANYYVLHASDMGRATALLSVKESNATAGHLRIDELGSGHERLASANDTRCDVESFITQTTER